MVLVIDISGKYYDKKLFIVGFPFFNVGAANYNIMEPAIIMLDSVSKMNIF